MKFIKFSIKMMQEFDPLGIGNYMRSRMRELLGPDVLGGTEPFDVPRFALDEPELLEEEPSFYINPDVQWAFPESELLPVKGPAQIGEKARGHRSIPGGSGTEILESTNARPARPPRRLFRVDVTENDDYYFLRADLAGMHKDNVKISVDEDNNIVSIDVEPPKDDFFGLYKSPLESHTFKQQQKQQQQSKIEEEHKMVEEKGPQEEEMVKETIPPSQPNQPELVHKKEVCHLIERCTQPMSRNLKMPKAVEMSKIEAEMRDGLLVVKFAKKPHEIVELKKHVIEIK
jgi:HSP20 family molecular chaperone IbpA